MKRSGEKKKRPFSFGAKLKSNCFRALIWGNPLPALASGHGECLATEFFGGSSNRKFYAQLRRHLGGEGFCTVNTQCMCYPSGVWTNSSRSTGHTSSNCACTNESNNVAIIVGSRIFYGNCTRSACSQIRHFASVEWAAKARGLHRHQPGFCIRWSNFVSFSFQAMAFRV